MTDEIKLPLEVVRMAARRLSAGQTTVEDVLERTLEHLREFGWIVASDLDAAEPAGTTHDTAGIYRLMWWPREVGVPFFDGSPGSHTIAPGSVKLTPEAVGPVDVPEVVDLANAMDGRRDDENLPIRVKTLRGMIRLLRAGGTVSDPPPPPAEKSTSLRIPKLGEMVLIRYAGEDCVGLVVGHSVLPDCPDSLNLFFFVPHSDTQKRAWNVRRPHWRWPDEPLASNPA